MIYSLMLLLLLPLPLMMMMPPLIPSPSINYSITSRNDHKTLICSTRAHDHYRASERSTEYYLNLQDNS